MSEEQAKETTETVEAKETKKTKDDSAKKWSSDIKKLGDKIVALTLMQAKELGDYLKEEYGRAGCRCRRYDGGTRCGSGRGRSGENQF